MNIVCAEKGVPRNQFFQSFLEHLVFGPAPLPAACELIEDPWANWATTEEGETPFDHIIMENLSDAEILKAVLSLFACSTLLINGIAIAATILVPADQPTIQTAIDFSVDGDVVSVSAGTYQENLDFSGKGVTVESLAGAATTIIDGGGTASVIVFSSNETRTSILRGFTITNGSASDGGGIFVRGASPIIEDNVITANTACLGAGIALEFASPLIQRNQVVSNTQGGCSGGFGGGINVLGAAQAEFYDNYIALNVAEDGAGISLFASGSPTIARNEITGNQASAQGGGIRMVNQSDVLIVNNLIHGNTATEGAAFFWSVPAGTEPKIRFNTVYDNSAISGSTIHASGFDGATEVTSNIIIAPAGQTAVLCFDTSTPLFASNNVQAPGGLLYDGACTGLAGTNGNLSVDPDFADAANADFRIRAGSPVLDVGLDDAAITVDILMNPRQIDGDGDQASVSDIGAYEAAPPAANAGADVTIDVNDSVTLDASGSSDIDGVIATYQWSQTAGTAVSLSEATTSSPTFTAPATAASLGFELAVTDDLGFVGTDQVTVTVNGPPPPPPSGGGGGSTGPTLLMLLLMFAVVGWLRSVPVAGSTSSRRFPAGYRKN